MSRTSQVRHLPTRIAYRMRAGVFLVTTLAGLAAEAQIKPHVLPPPKRNAVPSSKPAPAPAAAPAETGQSTARPGERPANTVMATPARTQTTPLVSPGHPAQMQMHLAEWMEAHRSLPLATQQQALENEPGFHNLRPEEQQRLHQQLNQLNRMAPEKLNQTIQFTETMERLAPPQRQQVRNVLGQLGSLPEDRQHAVKRAYLQLRDMPEPERQAYMNSAQFHGQFSDQERAAVGNMVNSASLLRQFEKPPATAPHE